MSSLKENVNGFNDFDEIDGFDGPTSFIATTKKLYDNEALKSLIMIDELKSFTDCNIEYALFTIS